MDHIDGKTLVSTAPPFAHVVVSGELDLATTPTLTARLSQAAAAGCRSFLVDLREVTFCDASTIGILVSLDNHMRATGGSSRIVGVSGRVRRIFDLVDLAHLLDQDDHPIDRVESLVSG